MHLVVSDAAQVPATIKQTSVSDTYYADHVELLINDEEVLVADIRTTARAKGEQIKAADT